MSDARLAAELAQRAGALLLRLQAESGLTGRELGKEGDARSNALLLTELAEQRPQDAVLSEESADSGERLTADRVWIIDPLDGTREFSMPGRTDWAVHVALWRRGQEITDAAVAQPALDAVYASDDAVAVAGLRERPVILVSDSRPPEFAPRLADALAAELQPMGSAGAKAMAVVRGDADVYAHAGGQYQWDSAAPVAIARAAGLVTCRLDGSPLVYNAPDPYLPDLLICRSELARPLLREIAAVGAR
jgi:3'(2'), 5'-bisphosphate nucleotidase